MKPPNIDWEQCKKFGCEKAKLTSDGLKICEEISELYRAAVRDKTISLIEADDMVTRERFKCGFRLERLMERW
jgi:hypothetical protein